MSYRDVREKLNEVMADPEQAECPFCQKPAPTKWLTTYGGRCYACYEAYKNAPIESRDVGQKERYGPRSWAHALRARHDSGERLTPAQIAAYRGALGAQIAVEE